MGIFEDLFGGANPPRNPLGPKPEKGVQLHGKEIGGVFYVRADDVAALLEVNGVLPQTSAALRKRIQS